MAILPRSTDFTAKDFSALNARFANLLASVFPDWSEKSRANFGNILAEQPAHVGDVVIYYLERAAREAFIDTAQLRRSLLGLVKLTGFRVRTASAGVTDETFTLAQAMSGTLTLPKGTKVKTAVTNAVVRCQILTDLVWLPGEITKTTPVEHSEFAVDVFESNGLANQVFQLTRTPFLDDSAVITAGNGTYDVVRNFLSSTSVDRHAVVVVDSNDKAFVRTGNGRTGAVPIGTVTIEYRIGGGRAGRLEAHTLTKLEGVPFKDSLGNIATIAVDNAERTTGASDRHSPAQIRLLAPESIRVVERATAREDYEIVTRAITGVARAVHLSRNETDAVDENSGITFIVPVGGGAPSASLLERVKAQFEPVAGYPTPPFPKSNTYNHRVLGAAYLPVDVLVKAFKRTGVTGPAMKASILAALARYFAILVDDDGEPDDSGVPNPLIDFGFSLKDADGNPVESLAYSDIFGAIREAEGVRKLSASPSDCTLNGAHADVAIGAYEFPIAGEIVVIDGDTGQTL